MSGCAVQAPAIVPSLSTFAFTFKGFDDPESGIRAYRWGLGTAPGLTDSYAMSSYAGAAGNNTTVHEISYVSTSTTVVNGATYYVTVEAENNAGPPLTSVASSAAVLVDATPVGAELAS